MLRDAGRQLCKRLYALSIVVAVAAGACSSYAQTADEGGVSFDGGGQEILQSIFVPYIANAPFSLTLATEWSRPMNNGGSFTVVNSRPIKRDSEGRIYQERWLMAPKGSKIPSQMSWIQIADPVAHTLYQCSVRQKVCELLTLRDSATLRFDPARFQSGPLKDKKGQQVGTRTHEDLGAQVFAGLLVHEYKDTTTLNAGVLGNDMPNGAAVPVLRGVGFQSELCGRGAADRAAKLYGDGDQREGA